MDNRTPLAEGLNIILGDAAYTIEEIVGLGANSIVYLASYKDNLHMDKKHRVLIKELFPYHPKGLIYRDESGYICSDSDAREYFDLHKKSFLRGNACHLDIQNIRADMAGININSFEKNGTLYTVLGNLNGETLLDVTRKGKIITSLSNVVSCMLSILDALEVFHKNRLLHLDISPDNILLMPLHRDDERYRRMILIDYNSTWNIDEFVKDDNVYFSIKDHYSPPEVRLQEKNSLSFASDLFSVCALFLEYLQGRPLDFSVLYSGGKILEPDAGLLTDTPATVRAKAAAIIKKGLKLPPNQRYQRIEDLRADLLELGNRINGIGITHSALWEASKAGFQNHVRINKRYGYLFQDSDFLPCRVSLDDKSYLFNEAIKFLSQSVCPHVEVTAAGGMGKTSALMRLWEDGISKYNPASCVPVYIPLYSYKTSSIPYIKGCLLERLKFDSRTVTIEDALRLMDSLLDIQFKGGPSILLLLDGLNEVSGDDRLLLLEIDELMKKSGVQVILTSRVKNANLKLHRLEILPLSEYDIKHYLKSRNILYPSDRVLTDIITNPMMLSIYSEACKNGQKTVDTDSMDGLLSEYISSLISAYKRQGTISETEQMGAEYAVKFLLPGAAHQMNKLKTGALSSSQIYKVVQKSYGMLTKKSFLKCFPEYIGRSKFIKNGAETPEEWFDDAVRSVLFGRFGLLYCDEHGNYRLSHQNFHDYFIREYNTISSKLNVVKRKLALSYAAVFGLVISAIIFTAVKVIERFPVSYPVTVQEKGAAENAMTALADSLSRLGMQIKNDTVTLDSYNGGYDGYRAVYEKNKKVNDTLVSGRQYTEDEIRLFVPPGSPVSPAILKDLLDGPGLYHEWSGVMFESLNPILEGDSGFPEGERPLVIKLYKQYLENYTNLFYIKMQLAILPLNDEGRKPILNSLPYMAVFGDKFLSQPFLNNKAELESVLKSENVKLQDISIKLKSYGMNVLF